MTTHSRTFVGFLSALQILSVAMPRGAHAQTVDAKAVAVAADLKARRATAAEVVDRLAKEYRQDAASTSAVLRTVGYAGEATATALAKVFRLDGESVARMMGQARFSAEETAKGLKAVGVTKDRTPRLLLASGYGITEVTRVARSDGSPVKTVVVELQKAGVDAVTVVDAVKGSYADPGAQLARDMVEAGYRVGEIVEALAGIGGATAEEVAGWLVDAGIDAVEAAAAVAEHMVDRTVPVIVGFVADVLGLDGLGDATAALLGRVVELLQRMGFSLQEIAEGLVEAGADPAAVADALTAAGFQAGEVAVAVWERVKDALTWLASKVPVSEVLEWALTHGVAVEEAMAWALDRGMAVADLLTAVANHTGETAWAVVQRASALTRIPGDELLEWFVDRSQSLPTTAQGVFWRTRVTVERAAEILRDAGRPAEDAAEWLVEAGFDPENVGEALVMFYELTPAALARVLHLAGVAVDVILQILMAVAGLTLAAATEILAALGGG